MRDPTNDDDDDDLVASGYAGEVKYARNPRGIMEAKEWLENEPNKRKASFDHLFRRLAESGVISNTEQFRHLGDGIYEFKRSFNRILCFKLAKIWYLTHRFKKGTKLSKEIEKAIRMRGRYEGAKDAKKNTN